MSKADDLEDAVHAKEPPQAPGIDEEAEDVEDEGAPEGPAAGE